MAEKILRYQTKQTCGSYGSDWLQHVHHQQQVMPQTDEPM